MSYGKYAKKSGGAQSLLDFLKKNWAVILGLFVAYPVITGFMKKAQLNSDRDDIVNANGNPTSQEDKLNQATGGNSNYKEVARGVYNDFGYSFPAWDPRRWTENDQAAYDKLKSCGSFVPQAVCDAYYIISRAERNLKEDCARILDPALLEQLDWE